MRGVRTLAAAFRCLSSHGVVVEIRGIGGQLRQVLARLGLTLPEAPDRSTPRVAAATALTPAAARPASAAIGG
jgi:anti-anti-sigma regulatory factor